MVRRASLVIWLCQLLNLTQPRFKKDCADQNSNCSVWATDGHCHSHPNYMLMTCPYSCRLCCPPLHLHRGSVAPQGFVSPGSSVNVWCEDGYRYSETRQFLTCQVTGRYDGKIGVCRKEHCDKITLSHGILSSSGLVKGGERTTVVCDEGYRYSQPGTYIYCNPLTLALEGTVGICQPEKCPEIKLEFGNVNPRGTIPPNTWVKIDCYKGFTYSETSPFLFCGKNGTYKGTKGDCVKSAISACSLDSMKNVVRRTAPLAGQTVEINCNFGFVYSLPFNSHMCSTQGRFEPPLGTCQPTDSCFVPKILHSLNEKEEVVAIGSWIRVTCLPGFIYSLLESAHICQENGKLGPEVGRCMQISCPPVHISNSLPIPARMVGTWMHVQCLPNYRYTLVKKIHMCLQSGRYTPPVGACVPDKVSQCVRAEIAHSKTPVSPVSVESWVRVECEEGYSYSRSNYLHYCQTDGTYDIPFGECIRNACPHVSILHGRIVTESPIHIGSLVQIECDEGYFYSLPTSLHFCNGDLQLEPKLGQCELVQCTELEVENAIVVPTTKPHAFQKVFLICMSGHEFVGKTPILGCLQDGLYDGEIGQCRKNKETSLHQEFIEAGFLTMAVLQAVNGKVETNNIENIDNNSLHNKDDRSNQFEIQDAASKGTTKSSHNTLTLSIKQLSNELVTLHPENPSETTETRTELGKGYCPSQTILHGRLEPSGKVRVNTTVQVNCFQGFLYSKSNSSLKCSEMGKLAPAIGSCLSREIYCDAPIREHGKILPPDPISSGLYFSIKCEPGYMLEGDHYSLCHKGSLISTLGYCKRVCLATPVEGGTLDKYKVMEGDTVTLTCLQNYRLTGPAFTTCNSSGHFHQPLGSCVLGECRLTAVPNGAIRTAMGLYTEERLIVGEVVSLECSSGYLLRGAGVSSCNSTFQLEPSLGRCVKACELPIRRFGLYSKFSVAEGEKVSMLCDSGYELVGVGSSMCKAGALIPTIGMCAKTDCHSGTPPHSSLAREGDTVKIVCDEGYFLEGRDRVYCKDLHLLGTCKRKRCKSPKVDNGSAVPAEVQVGGTVTVRCNHGFNYMGSPVSTCMENGVLEPPLAHCRNKLSPCLPPKILNGFLIAHFKEGYLESGTMFTLQCDTGFHPSSEVTRGTCYDGRVLIRTMKSLAKCDRQLCSLPSVVNGNIHVKPPGVIKVGTRGRVQCHDGYYLEGESHVQCLLSGRFSRPGTCQPVRTYCVLNEVKHGRLVFEEEHKTYKTVNISGNVGDIIVKVGERVKLICDHGYYTHGEAFVTCTGKQELRPPICTLSNPAVRCKTDMIKGTVAMDTILSAGDAITVECSEGSFFSGGSPTKICGNDGKLHPSGGLCVPNVYSSFCPIPNISNSSDSLLDRLEAGESYFLSCLDGFVVQGETMTTCRQDGTLYPPLGYCVGVCDVNRDTDNGTLSPAGRVLTGTLISAICKPGYFSTAPSVCSVNSFTPPLCLPPSCRPPSGAPQVGPDHVTYTLPCNNTYTCFTDGRVEETDRPCRRCRASQITSGFVVPQEGTHFSATCYSGFFPTRESWSCGEKPGSCVRPCQNLTRTNGVLAGARWPPLPGDSVRIEACQPGYQITGYSTVTCMKSDSPQELPQFDKELGTCQPVFCPQLFVEDGAVLPEGRPRAGKKVFVNCEIGWNLVGPGEAWCRNDGTYTEYHLGPCVKTSFNRCPLKQPLNGYTTPLLPSVAEGTFVQIHCNKSFQLVGNNFVRCMDIGQFDYPLGTCVSQLVSSSNSTGNITHCEEYKGKFGNEGIIKPSGKVRVGEEIVLACLDGWTVVGNLTAECRPNGTYSHTLGVCAFLTCPEIVPRKGVIEPGGRLKENELIRLTCPPGHVIIGAETARCIRGGFYNESIGECRNTCQKPAVKNADVQIYQSARIGIRISYDLRGTIYEGSIVSIYCERGYKLHGNQRLRCRENGTYDVDTPDCRRTIHCDVPDISNGYTGTPGSIPQGETVHMACKYGLPDGHQSATCLPTGFLDRTLGTCASYGFCTINRDNASSPSPYTLHPGSHYNLVCEEGYLVVGNAAVRCMGSEKFNATLGFCIKTNVTCTVPVRENGVTAPQGALLPGRTVLLRCQQDFVSNGNTAATCLRNGTLDHDLGTCVKDYIAGVCVSPKVIGGYPSIWGHVPKNAKLAIICHSDFRLRGNHIITCLGNGHYDKAPGECVRRYCTVRIPHGDTYRIMVNTTTSIKCKEGYRLIGDAQLSCTETGIRSGYPQCLKSGQT